MRSPNLHQSNISSLAYLKMAACTELRNWCNASNGCFSGDRIERTSRPYEVALASVRRCDRTSKLKVTIEACVISHVLALPISRQRESWSTQIGKLGTKWVCRRNSLNLPFSWRCRKAKMLTDAFTQRDGATAAALIGVPAVLTGINPDRAALLRQQFLDLVAPAKDSDFINKFSDISEEILRIASGIATEPA